MYCVMCRVAYVLCASDATEPRALSVHLLQLHYSNVIFIVNS